jgi:DnaK suppressor protein
MKELLLQMRAELQNLATVGEEQAGVVELDQSKVGRLSRMDAMQAQAMAQETLRRRKSKLRAISEALQRIEDDEFGLCLGCDEQINPQRLAVDPTALYCIHCASRIEAS